jgi:DNA-binding Lrp family transcriptional regulator
MKNNNLITDGSGDRKYFTQIPNMIVNHSTAYEQSLYLIMKRVAGENGSCYISLNALAKKMGIDKRTVSKTITKLLKRKWIMEIEPIKIKGGNVRQFKIVDLWPLNIKEYESGGKMHYPEVVVLSPEVVVKCNQSGGKMHPKNIYKEDILRRGELDLMYKRYQTPELKPASEVIREKLRGLN